MSTRPTVVFICVRNSGKSQMAAALMRKIAGNTIIVYSAGTEPGTGLNAQSVAALAEVGADTAGEYPKLATLELLDKSDRIILLGEEVHLDSPGGRPVERWTTDEPSDRGITGMGRMRLIRDDIAGRVQHLHDDLTGQNGTTQ